MNILGIETSCDDTAVAIYSDTKGILSNIVSSQIQIHQQWGGVFPELAAREHTKNILYVLDTAIKEANITPEEIDGIAVTVAPGLIVSLVIGFSAAKALSLAWDKLLIPVHHIEAHIFANFIEKEVPYPFLALVVSGGHTELHIIKGFENYQFLGGTLDDAVGEAYDKVARMLGLGYPGGPIIDKLAKEGREVIKFPRPLIKDKGKNKFNFSFSGLKSAVLREIEKGNFKKEDIAKSFQEAATDVLVYKTIDAAMEFNIKNIVVAGGVSANSRLREKLLNFGKTKNLNIHFPPLYLCTDNAAMVAYTGFKRFKEKHKTINLDFEAKARLRLDKFVDILYKS